ncbi:hypothetical protein DL93DRAFT_1746855 [Clavulina sp. PMI_390]|nr:hypothetical protein DL93DRAFT_1746855 [Clavulina sp. PMI_390]
MYAGGDVHSRGEMLRCAHKLVDICKELRVRDYPHDVHSSVVPMVHMMNAVRVFAHELRGLAARENTQLSNEYCASIEVILDFLSEMTTFYPEWKDSPELLKSPLSTAMDALRPDSRWA